MFAACAALVESASACLLFASGFEGGVVAGHHGPTVLNYQSIDFIILRQIYDDSNPKHQWIDDIEIWSGLPERYSGAP